MDLDTSKNLVSFATVSRACHEIVQAGNQPSVRKVTGHLGGGSPNQITPMLKRWREEQSSVQAQTRVVIDARIGDIISAQIHDAVTAARVNADAERDGAFADLQLLSERGLALEEQAASDAARLRQLESEHLKDLGVVSALRDELVLVKIEMSKAGEVVKAEATDTVLSATKMMREERDKAESLHIQSGALTAQLANLTEKLSDSKLEVSHLRDLLAASEATRHTAIQSASVAVTRNEALQHRTERAESQWEKLIGTHESAVKNLHQAELQIQNYQLKNQALMHELEVGRPALVQASEQLKPGNTKKPSF